MRVVKSVQEQFQYAFQHNDSLEKIITQELQQKCVSFHTKQTV